MNERKINLSKVSFMMLVCLLFSILSYGKAIAADTETETSNEEYVSNAKLTLSKTTFDCDVDNLNDILKATSVEFDLVDGSKYSKSGFREDSDYVSVDGFYVGDEYHDSFYAFVNILNEDGNYVDSYENHNGYYSDVGVLEPGKYTVVLEVENKVLASRDITVSGKFEPKADATVTVGRTLGKATTSDAYVAKFVPSETGLYHIYADRSNISGYSYYQYGIITNDADGNVVECPGYRVYRLEKGKAYYFTVRPYYCDEAEFEVVIEKSKEIEKIDMKMKQNKFPVGYSYNIFLYENEENYNISYDITITYTDGTVVTGIKMGEEISDPYGNYLHATMRRTDNIERDFILEPAEYEMFFVDGFGNEFHNDNRIFIELPENKVPVSGENAGFICDTVQAKNNDRYGFTPAVSGYYIPYVEADMKKDGSNYSSIFTNVMVVGNGYYNTVHKDIIDGSYSEIYLEAGKEYTVWAFTSVVDKNGDFADIAKEANQINVYFSCDLTKKDKLVTNESSNIDVLYRTHVQSFGWQDFVKNGLMSGTSGLAKRLEGIEIKLDTDYDLGIQYTTHVQSYGWLDWSANGEMSGTTGEAKRLEAIKIQLTGADKDKFDIYYRVHAQSYGWLGWAKNGEASGTAGYAKRLEAIQIVIVPKGEKPSNTYEGITSATTKAYVSADGKTNVTVAGADKVHVIYQPMVEGMGWLKPVKDQASAGTTGSAKRLEALKVSLGNQLYEGGIRYKSHVQTYGWEKDWKYDGEISGNTTQGKRLEAIQIELYGEMAEKYDVYYRTHVQKFGWLGWAKNGQQSGSAGYAYRIEAIEIVLVPKGGRAPGSTANCFKQK